MSPHLSVVFREYGVGRESDHRGLVVVVVLVQDVVDSPAPVAVVVNEGRGAREPVEKQRREGRSR